MTQGRWLRWCLITALLITPRHAWGDKRSAPSEINAKSPSGWWKATVTPANYYQSKTSDKLPAASPELIPSESKEARKISDKDMASMAKATVSPKEGEPHTFTLRSPWMPMDIVLLDDGTLVTFDQWSSYGNGEVCIAYNPSGEVRWSRTIEDLIGLERIFFALSPAEWRSQPLIWSLEPGNKVLLIRLYDENQLRIRLADGNATVIEVSNLPDDPNRLYRRAFALRSSMGGIANGELEDWQIVKANEVIAILQSAARLKIDAPDLDHEIHYNLISALQLSNQHERVVEIGMSAIKRLRSTPGFAIANFYKSIAESQEKMGLMEDALRSLRAAVALVPNNEQRIMDLAELLYKHVSPNEADAVLHKFAAQKGDVISEAQLFGKFYRNADQPDKALDYYLKFYKPDVVTDDVQGSLYEDIAETYVVLKNPRAAIAVFKQVVAYYKTIVAEGGPEYYDGLAQQIQEKVDRLQKILASVDGSH
jgi:tetratricopeptide (TPR) repeat protein